MTLTDRSFGALLLMCMFLAPVAGADPIHDAAKNGNVEEVTQVIAAGTDVNAMDFTNVSPLFYAVNKGDEAVVRLLVSSSADVNSTEDRGLRPLDNALAFGFWDIAEFLKSQKSQGAKCGTASNSC